MSNVDFVYMWNNVQMDYKPVCEQLTLVQWYVSPIGLYSYRYSIDMHLVELIFFSAL